MIEGLNEAFADYFGLTSFEALKLTKIHINELIPDFSDNISVLLNQKRDECLSFKGILNMPDNFSNGDQSTYGFGGLEESSEDIGGNQDSPNKRKTTLKSLNLDNYSRIFKKVRKYSISYDIALDSFHPHGMSGPLKIFIVNLIEVNDMTKSSSSLFFSQKKASTVYYNQDTANTKIIITKAREITVESILFNFSNKIIG